ncbi:MAG: ATP-binding protein [Duodenibacillus sp.]|nr:ATP-binding protein [Duodenibacillus sp.]
MRKPKRNSLRLHGSFCQKAIELWILRLFLKTGIWRDYDSDGFYDFDSLMQFSWMKDLRLEINLMLCIFENDEFLRTGKLESAKLDLVGERLESIKDDDDYDMDAIVPKEERLDLIFEHLPTQKLRKLDQRLEDSRRSAEWKTLGEMWCTLMQREANVSLVDDVSEPSSLRKALNRLEDELSCGFLKLDTPFSNNLKDIEKAFGFTDAQTEALAFFIAAAFNDQLQDVLLYFDYVTGGRELMTDIVACALKRSPQEVSDICRADGALSKSGLVTFSIPQFEIFCANYTLLDNKSFGTLLAEKVSLDRIFLKTIVECPPAELKLEHFSHIPNVARVLVPYVKDALETSRKGVNILFYGLPGTGKTQLARVVAERCDARVFEVSPKANNRLQCWKMCNSFLGYADKTVLVIDEAEDIFNEDIDSDVGTVIRRNKASLHWMLETAPIPNIWISNSVSSIAPSMLRRFDLIFEVSSPDAEGRRRMVDDAFGNTLSHTTRERLVLTRKLTPAVMKRAASVAQTVRETADTIDEVAVVDMIDEVLRAQDYGTVAAASSVLPAFYDPKFVNADIDLDALAKGLAHAGGAKICLYGPPGTGKSAYAAWLAQQLNRPLVRRTVAELTSCFVGETEKQIAQAFREASRDNAVLLLDEADSFLRDRKLANYGWEATQVNELLTQLEAFEGYFVATTNLLDSFDGASLRRFDLKAKFDFLKPEQAVELAGRVLATTNIALDDAARDRIGHMAQLTPGDFTAVMRQSRFHPLADAVDFAGRLAQEVLLKDPYARSGHRPAGFS